LAGISKMSYPKYLFLNIVGGAVWVVSLVGGGYWFGIKFPWIINYVHYVILFSWSLQLLPLSKDILISGISHK
jgi:membrane-associated protein